jgi:hypothetical protein
MYDVRHDRSKDIVFAAMVLERIYKKHVMTLEVVKDVYTKHGKTEFVKEVEKDFNEFWMEFHRLSKERGLEFNEKEVINNLPNNMWPKIIDTYRHIIFAPDPGYKPLNEYSEEELDKDAESLNNKILQYESEHKKIQ